MATYRHPKYRKHGNHSALRKANLTGEDIDMLNEKRERVRSDSPSYKDDIDGA